jgi:hypothetical protein
MSDEPYEEIVWDTRDQWDYTAYSLNTRLHVMAGNQQVVDGLSEECRQKFGKEPDVTPKTDDILYFREAGYRKRQRKP